MFEKVEHLQNWYTKNLNKLVLFLLVIVIVSLTVLYIPYLNVIFSPSVRLLIIISFWYILFPSSLRTLVIISIGVLLVASLFTVFQLNLFAEALGELLYILLILIFFDYVKDFLHSR